jgi:hypothetical protein
MFSVLSMIYPPLKPVKGTRMLLHTPDKCSHTLSKNTKPAFLYAP